VQIVSIEFNRTGQKITDMLQLCSNYVTLDYYSHLVYATYKIKSSSSVLQSQ